MAKVAVLIDGGYFLKRFPTLYPGQDSHDAQGVVKRITWLIGNHLKNINNIYRLDNHWALLFRSFYYDARPHEKETRYPVSREVLNYSKTPEARFRNALFTELRKTPNMALRLGDVRREGSRNWVLREKAQKDLLARRKTIDNLNDRDFAPALRQKGVDMRLGIDMASLCLKKQVDIIVLVAGDSDFVPAAKMARREGIRIILDPLWQNVDEGLFEHIDGLTSGVASPARIAVTTDTNGDN